MKRIYLAVAVILLSGSSVLYIQNSHEAEKPYTINYGDLPPLPAPRMEVYAFYKMQFLEDGYPGRRHPDGEVVPHPIYGPYVISDYLSQYASTGETRYLDAARKVADAAIKRMTKVGDALIFYYLDEYNLSSFKGKYYSGLTQSRYMQTFAELGKVTGDEKYKQAGEAAFHSLLIPMSEHGVYHEFADGSALIEELPNQLMTHYTFNGWLTAVMAVHTYAELSQSADAKEVFEKNVKALKRLLPLFDVPELANTRYRLAGRQLLRVTFSNRDVEWESARMDVPEEGTFDVQEEAPDNFDNYYIEKSRDDVQLNTMVNYISYPKNNALIVELDAEEPVEMTVAAMVGAYDPFSVEPKQEEWREVSKVKLEAGKHTVRTEIPWEKIPLAAYPTNFAKKIGGNYYNAYHFIHITGMDDLYKITKDPIFAKYAEKWRGYVKQWPTMPVYRDQNIVLEPYSSTK